MKLLEIPEKTLLDEVRELQRIRPLNGGCPNCKAYSDGAIAALEWLMWRETPPSKQAVVHQ